ncbi:MAG: nitroreductase family protein [Propionibacteriaceae bacterium]|jgi:nitroreductase|nr:nitroreductase family protein [Propionibacteriaceae bacterium]
MTETLAVIANRYSCRAFTDTPVDPEKLRHIAQAGIHAPSARNRQPWRFIVISDKSAIEKIDAIGMERLKEFDPAGHSRMMDRGGTMLYNATALIVIAGEILDSPYPVSMDTGIAASHIALAAASLGVNSCIAAIPLVAFKDETIKATYIPEGFEFSVAVLLGYAVEPGTPHTVDPDKIISM